MLESTAGIDLRRYQAACVATAVDPSLLVRPQHASGDTRHPSPRGDTMNTKPFSPASGVCREKKTCPRSKRRAIFEQAFGFQISVVFIRERRRWVVSFPPPHPPQPPPSTQLNSTLTHIFRRRCMQTYIIVDTDSKRTNPHHIWGRKAKQAFYLSAALLYLASALRTAVSTLLRKKKKN